jgi:beta-glucanase (GH16 family)
MRQKVSGVGAVAWRRRRRLMASFGALLLGASAVVTLAASAERSSEPRLPAAAAGHVRQQPTTAAARARQWVQIWRDDFSGPAGRGVNSKFWRYDTGRGVFGTGEIETMTRSARNVHLDGRGSLDITARGHGQSWTSGRVQTKSFAFAAPAGGMLMVTASVKQPDPRHGLGYWPAFWMLGPGQWPGTGEVDILENVNALTQHSGTFHCGNLTHRNPDGTLGPCHEYLGLSSGLLRCKGCLTGYHTYSVIIDRTNPANEQIRWYLDGRQYYAVSAGQVGHSAWTKAVDHGFSIIFDLAIGGSYPDAVCGCTSPGGQTSSGGTLRIRYVAAYDRTGGAS